MKEISQELEKRDVAICVACGAIFEGAENIMKPCPECGANVVDREGLYWVSPNHSWIVGLENSGK